MRIFKEVGIIFIVWRLYLVIAAFIGAWWLPFRPSFPYWDTVLVGTKLPQGVWQWANFDGVHYLTLAQRGYDGFGTQVFFPLYPLLIRIVGIVFGGNYLLAGLLISNVSILVAAILLYRLILNKYNQSTARWAVVFLFAFPLSYVFGSVYTEALFLLLLLSAFYTTGIMAGFMAVMAGGTRIIGVFVGLGLVLKKNWWGVLGILGLILFSGYLFLRFGNPFLFLSAQSAFGNARSTSLATLVNPLQVIFRYLKIFVTVSYRQYDFWVALLEFLAFIFGSAVLIYASIKKIFPRDWLIFSWAALILPVLSGTLSSMPRYLIVIFPLYIWLAMIKSKTIKLGLVVTFIVLLGLFTSLFIRGYWLS